MCIWKLSTLYYRYCNNDSLDVCETFQYFSIAINHLIVLVKKREFSEHISNPKGIYLRGRMKQKLNPFIYVSLARTQLLIHVWSLPVVTVEPVLAKVSIIPASVEKTIRGFTVSWVITE